MLDPEIRTTETLLAAMARVSFERSCLDMAWEWQSQVIFVPVEPGTQEQCSYLPIGYGFAWRIRCSFQRPDRETGKIGRGFGRWWIIDFGTTESAFWKTMGFLAARTIVDHELFEAFKVDGKRPFDPHRTVQDLCEGAPR